MLMVGWGEWAAYVVEDSFMLVRCCERQSGARPGLRFWIPPITPDFLRIAHSDLLDWIWIFESSQLYSTSTYGTLVPVADARHLG